MTKASKMTVAALVTALSLGGLTAFAMGVSNTSSGDSASSLSGDSAKAKVIRIRKVKKVPVAGNVPVSSSSGYASTSYASTGSSSSAPSVQSPDKGASAVRPPSSTDQGGWDDDGGQEYEDHEGGEGHDD